MTEHFTKKLRIGAITNYYGRKRPVDVYVKVRFDGDLSISGVIGPTRSGNAIGGCGQIDMEFAHRLPEHDDSRYHNLIEPEDIDFASGWDTKKWYTLLDVWRLYHLNDMHAGCEHQRAMGWGQERIDKSKPRQAYGRFYPGQSHDTWNSKGWIYPPHGHLTEQCPICGYRYGTEWKREEVPEDILEWLMGLPDTDKQPAWI